MCKPVRVYGNIKNILTVSPFTETGEWCPKYLGKSRVNTLYRFVVDKGRQTEARGTHRKVSGCGSSGNSPAQGLVKDGPHPRPRPGESPRGPAAFKKQITDVSFWTLSWAPTLLSPNSAACLFFVTLPNCVTSTLDAKQALPPAVSARGDKVHSDGGQKSGTGQQQQLSLQ